MAENPKNVVMSVAKAFAVLRAFGPDLAELTISEIAARTDLDRGTSFRLLHTLRDLGYVVGVPGCRRFRLTLKCLELGYLPLAHSDLKTLSRPLLVELCADLADAASLGMLDGPDVVYVERVQGDIGRRHVDRRTGSRTGIYAAALGQAILAFDTPERQREVLEMAERPMLSERTITDIDALLARMGEIRERGWALSDGENAYGLRTVAAPIFDHAGRAVAAISATVRADRCSLDDFVAAAVPRVLAVTGDLTTAIRLSFGEIVRGVQRP
ncbi:IclR family transcriptional regulator [Siculibacillus lacustris]|uniref:IclR family transcriptional regulator n=1 Tax=Siculibacillus lacustris TaxID=1549641 RepID=A0A4Q9VWW5_9HYPH|nr:IclR family transcriptional regulator [Siculibacillus lacustris]TBW40857.1 IclR family transcriptional regulator [Siculibacillus lacustris]